MTHWCGNTRTCHLPLRLHSDWREAGRDKRESIPFRAICILSSSGIDMILRAKRLHTWDITEDQKTNPRVISAKGRMYEDVIELHILIYVQPSKSSFKDRVKRKEEYYMSRCKRSNTLQELNQPKQIWIRFFCFGSMTESIWQEKAQTRTSSSPYLSPTKHPRIALLQAYPSSSHDNFQCEHVPCCHFLPSLNEWRSSDPTLLWLQCFALEISRLCEKSSTQLSFIASLRHSHAGLSTPEKGGQVVCCADPVFHTKLGKLGKVNDNCDDDNDVHIKIDLFTGQNQTGQKFTSQNQTCLDIVLFPATLQVRGTQGLH